MEVRRATHTASCSEATLTLPPWRRRRRSLLLLLPLLLLLLLLLLMCLLLLLRVWQLGQAKQVQ